MAQMEFDHTLKACQQTLKSLGSRTCLAQGLPACVERPSSCLTILHIFQIDQTPQSIAETAVLNTKSCIVRLNTIAHLKSSDCQTLTQMINLQIKIMCFWFAFNHREHSKPFGRIHSTHLLSGDLTNCFITLPKPHQLLHRLSLECTPQCQNAPSPQGHEVCYHLSSTSPICTRSIWLMGTYSHRPHSFCSALWLHPELIVMRTNGPITI